MIDDENDPFFYFIVYPGGDRSKLTVVYLNEAIRYEKNDYAIASQLEFETAELAAAYARPLAKRWGKEYEPYDGETLPGEILDANSSQSREAAEQAIRNLYGLDSVMGKQLLMELIMDRGFSMLSDEAVIELAQRQERMETIVSREADKRHREAWRS